MKVIGIDGGREKWRDLLKLNLNIIESTLALPILLVLPTPMNDDSTPREVAVSPPDASEAASPLAPKSVRSDELLHGQRELLIIHEHEVYRLRVTRNGKLILTK